MTAGARLGRMAGVLLAVILSAGCGAVGSPVAPESIGVAAQQAREKEREEKAAGERKEAPLAPKPAPAEEAPAPEAAEEEEQVLPDLRPIGTR